MRLLPILILSLILTACRMPAITPAAPPTEPTASQVPTDPPTLPAPSETPAPTATLAPSLTPEPTATPYASLGTVALDFIALLCNAEWLNGGQHLEACPATGADQSGGFAAAVDPVAEGLPFGTPVLLTVPSWNGFSSLFLRYPSFTVHAGDRFRATLLCRPSTPCDMQFALQYYDANGEFRGTSFAWDLKSGDAPLEVDVDLSAFAGQTLDFVLVLRLFHLLDNPQQDHGLWIAPHIYRPPQ